MDAKELFRLLHNLDIREPLRKYYPQYGIIAVNEDAEIVGFKKFKNPPTWKEQDVFFEKHKGAAYFLAYPGMYPKIEDIHRKINTCQKCLKNRDKFEKNRGKGLVGETYYGPKKR